MSSEDITLMLGEGGHARTLSKQRAQWMSRKWLCLASSFRRAMQLLTLHRVIQKHESQAMNPSQKIQATKNCYALCLCTRNLCPGRGDAAGGTRKRENAKTRKRQAQKREKTKTRKRENGENAKTAKTQSIP